MQYQFVVNSTYIVVLMVVVVEVAVIVATTAFATTDFTEPLDLFTFDCSIIDLELDPYFKQVHLVVELTFTVVD